MKLGYEYLVSLNHSLFLEGVFIVVVLCTIIFTAGLFVIFVRNPIHSILSLILVFFNSAVLLMLLEVEFLGLMFLIVYVGAIAVLFLFIVMMLNLKLVDMGFGVVRYLPLAGLVSIIFVLELFLVINQPMYNGSLALYNVQMFFESVKQLSNLEVLGLVIYTYNWLLFIIAGVILLVAIIGAIGLTLMPKGNNKRQDSWKQVYTKITNSLYLTDIKSFKQ